MFKIVLVALLILPAIGHSQTDWVSKNRTTMTQILALNRQIRTLEFRKEELFQALLKTYNFRELFKAGARIGKSCTIESVNVWVSRSEGSEPEDYLVLRLVNNASTPATYHTVTLDLFYTTNSTDITWSGTKDEVSAYHLNISSRNRISLNAKAGDFQSATFYGSNIATPKTFEEISCPK